MNNTDFSTPETINYSQYQHEQIHISGSIQPHGVLIALQKPDLIILQVSENIQQFFGISAQSLLGQNLNCLLSPEQIQLISDCLKNNQPTFIHLLELPAHFQEDSALFMGILHESNGVLILELELHATIKMNPLLGYTHLLEKAIYHIRNASHLPDLYQNIAQEIRKITQFDRVMIYKFEADSSGVVIAEDKQANLESYLGLHYPAFID